MTALPEASAAPRITADVSLAAAVRAMTRAFAGAGLESPDLDARIILTRVLGIDRGEFILAPDRPVGGSAPKLAEAARRRLGREPIARVVGTAEFWSLSFDLDPHTLIPRPDTETIVEAALAEIAHAGRLGDVPLRILDLGTGSGAILVALLHELPHATGLGIDVAPGAVRQAARNARRNEVGARALFCTGNWAAALRGRFDLVVANPPYVARPALAGLEPEVRLHDPLLALDGGEDGLDAYRAIIPDLPRLLSAGGCTIFEVGAGQAKAVSALLEGVGLHLRGARRDLAGHERAVIAAQRPR